MIAEDNVFGNAAMTVIEAPRVRWSDKALSLDPSKPRGPQIARIAAQMFGILGGPVLGLIGMLRYPMLIPDRDLLIGGLASIMFWFAVSFFIMRGKAFPTGMPSAAKLMARFGIAVCATAWTVGFVGIANGCATPLIARDAPVAYKRTSRDSDPKRRSHYVGARLWSSSRDVVELSVPQAIFNRLDVPDTGSAQPDLVAMPDRGHVRLSVGQGRFGIDWLHGVVGVAPSVSQ
jgi:hypothetical protein